MKWFNHLRTINHHKLLVMKHCFQAGIYKQGVLHDLSKYSPVEFLVGAKYFQGDRSPNDAERRDRGYSKAWLHHKGRNRHHMEYWIDYADTDNQGTIRMSGIEMPLCYVIEMFCDRIAACKTYRKEKYTDADSYQYFLKSHSHYLIHKNTENLLEELLSMLQEKGERETFLYIRTQLLPKAKIQNKKTGSRHSPDYH